MTTSGGHVTGRAVRRARALAAAAGLVCLGVAAVPVVAGLHSTGQAAAAQGNGRTNDNCVEPSNGTGNCISTFGVTVGSVNPILPSQRRTMPVTFTNPNSFDISVTSYVVSVTTPSGRGCAASHLLVPAGTQRPAGGIAVPKKGSSGITIPVTLSNTVTDSCKGVPFSVTVDASGVKK